MLYELIGVCRPGRGVREIKEIAKTAGTQVLSAGGVVRGVTNWGVFLLPKPRRKQGELFHQGHYFILRFDSNAKTQHMVKRTLSLDPRMIRFSIVKLASKLEDLKDFGSKAEWSTTGAANQIR